MPPSDERVSDEEQEEPQNVSVYDFLYHDARRIGSFLAQFDDSGHLQQVRQSESAKRGHKRGYKLGGTLGVPVVVTGGVTFERTPHDEGSEASERVYDPLWSNALALLDYLEDAHLLHRDITTANIGQFVIASGSLSLLNAGVLPKIWQSEAVKRVAIETSRRNAKAAFDANPANAALSSSERAKLEKAVLQTAEQHGKTAMEVMPHFPHAAQCTISGSDSKVWSSLLSDGLVTAPGDLSLKHGTEIPGTWNLLGILDALPSPIQPQTAILPTNEPFHLETLIRNFSNLGRTLLGRPPDAYGVTPLLLFRKVAT